MLRFLKKITTFQTPQAVLIGFILIAAALYFGTNTPAASQDSNSGPKGPFHLSAPSSNLVWRIDEASGAVSYCIRTNPGMTDRIVQSTVPICSGWSN